MIKYKIGDKVKFIDMSQIYIVTGYDKTGYRLIFGEDKIKSGYTFKYFNENTFLVTPLSEVL